MNKGLVLVIILSMTTLLAGCSTQTSSGTTFIGGTEGLRTTFLQGNPPTITTDGGTSGFAIAIKTENVGESDINATDGYIQIWGLEAKTYNFGQQDFTLKFNDPSQSFGQTLRGAQRNTDGSIINGGVSTISFGNLKYLATIQGDQQNTVWANICYRYSTKVAAQLCVKNDAEQALDNTDICTVEGEKNPQNSGAPIHVTSLKEAYAGNGKISITLTIAHVGTGDNFFKDDNLECNDTESNIDRGKVRVTFDDVLIAGKSVPVICQGTDNGYIQLFKDSNGESTTLYCTIDVSGTNNIVQVPVNLQLSYVYLQHITQPITIRHIGS